MTSDEIDLGGLENDKDLSEMIASEQKKMQFQQQINQLNDLCWDKCVGDKMGTKFDCRTESCLSNCVSRFIDTSVIITKKFGETIQNKFS